MSDKFAQLWHMLVSGVSEGAGVPLTLSLCACIHLPFVCIVCC